MKQKLLFFFIAFSSTHLAVSQSASVTLHHNWQFRKLGDSKWMNATVPGTVHTDLMANKLIPDPYYRDNEKKVQWVSQEDWEYQTSFDVSTSMFQMKNIELQFEGLDTYADVFLNGEKVLAADNMFRTWHVPVKSLLKQKGNVLVIRFASPDKKVDELAKAALPLVRPSDNNRHYARKAQYHYGWDWGPKLITSGIWRPVKLKAWNTEDKPAALISHNDVALIQEADAIGTSFYFTVNGKPVFMKGANWIPADMFLPRITKAKYRALLTAAKDANINMLRVWGGGIYEDENFYDLCDSLGIYVWQDFMFAGAMYPGDDKFLENVKQEAIDNLKRLNRHPCIVVWAGNNEIDEAWHNWGWQKDLPADQKEQLWNEYKKLFHELLPQLVKSMMAGPISQHLQKMAGAVKKA
jgi:beta-mannosidase